MKEKLQLLRRLCACVLIISMFGAFFPLVSMSEAGTAYKLSYILNKQTFDGEDYYDLKNTATGETYGISTGNSNVAITDYNYEAGFKIKLSNPGGGSIIPIQLMGSRSYNLLGNIKLVSYEKHDYAYRLLIGNTLLADKNDGLVTDGETWNDIRFVIRETPSDGDVSTTSDDTVSYDLYINGKLVSTQKNIAVDGLNGAEASTRNPYKLNFKHYTNAGNSVLIDDVWIAKYVPYELLTTYKLDYTLKNTTFSGEDYYDLKNTASGGIYENSAKSTNAITDYNYEAGFKIKFSNPGADSIIPIQLMGSKSQNLIGNVKFVAYNKHGYDYRLLLANDVLADRDDGLVTDGETWNNIRFVIRETPSDGDASTTDDDTVSYDVYVNGKLVSTQTNIAVSGLNGAEASTRNPYKLNFKHYTNAGNSVLIDDVWIAKYVLSGIGWEFDDEADLKNSWISSSKNYSVADGKLIYNAPAEFEDAVAITYAPVDAIDNSIFKGLRVKMKHSYLDSYIKSGTMKLYLTGTAAKDGEAVNFDYTTGEITAMLGETSNDFVEYDFSINEIIGDVSIADASITSMKLVPMDCHGSFVIESIWLVDDVSKPLDAEKMSIGYEFADKRMATAMGTITLDFGGQKSSDAKNVELYWASGNKEEGYTLLPDYTRIKKLMGSEAEKGYSITKNMIIPPAAKLLIARVTDIEKTFDIAYELPDEKLLEEKEPGVVIALTSDFHFGDPTYQTHVPSAKMLKARELINSQADAVIVNGDTIDTFGGRSWYTVRGMNGLGSYGYRMDPAEEESEEVTITYYKSEVVTDENGESYKVLTDEPTGRVETVKNTDVYDMAYDYFTGFDIPVYLVEGNHESPEAAYLDYIGVSPQRTKRLLTRFIDWSVANGKYPEPIERKTGIYDNRFEDNISYDDYIVDDKGNEYHCIFLRNFGSERPVKWLTKEELDWLDKKLYENESTGKPIFVMSHIMPVRNKAGKMESYGYFGLNFPEFEKVINKHPGVVVVSGHTHQTADRDSQNYYDGAEEEPSFISLPTMKMTGINDSSIDAAYAMLVYAEMYDDRIITRAFETTTEKNPARGLGQITRKPIPVAMGSLVVERIENGDGTYTLTASCDDAAATYNWILSGEELSGSSVTISESYEGYIAVRATDAEGNYISDSFDGIYDEEFISSGKKMYFAVAGQKNGLNPLADAEGEEAVWVNGVGGKNSALEAAQLTASDEESVYYQLENLWTKKGGNSRYLTVEFDAMPKNESSGGIFVASGDTKLSADMSGAVEVNKWNHITVVCDIASGKAETYVNGALQGLISQAPVEGQYLRFGIESLIATDFECYIDNLVVYETEARIVLPKRIEKTFAERTENTLYSAENKTLYIPDGTPCSELGTKIDCVVVSENGNTKNADSVVADGDFAVQFDAVSRQYVYYDIVTYSDYDRIVLGGSIENSDILLYVNAKTAGDTVVIAYYDSQERFVGCEYTAVTSAGLNKVLPDVKKNAHSAKVMMWEGIDSIIPLTEAVVME